jgi:hypothetical protein
MDKTASVWGRKFFDGGKDRWGMEMAEERHMSLFQNPQKG